MLKTQLSVVALHNPLWLTLVSTEPLVWGVCRGPFQTQLFCENQGVTLESPFESKNMGVHFLFLYKS